VLDLRPLAPLLAVAALAAASAVLAPRTASAMPAFGSVRRVLAGGGGAFDGPSPRSLIHRPGVENLSPSRRR